MDEFEKEGKRELGSKATNQRDSQVSKGEMDRKIECADTIGITAP